MNQPTDRKNVPTKRCPKCQQTKSRQEFHKSKSRPDGMVSHCKACDKIKYDTYRTQNREKYNAQRRTSRARKPGPYRAAMKRWKDRNAGKLAMRRLKQVYGLTEAEFTAMLVQQDHKCKICQKVETYVRTGKKATAASTDSPGKVSQLSVDHDHVTGKIRGLLCHNCNVGLGKFLDDPTALEAAARYLRDAAAENATCNTTKTTPVRRSKKALVFLTSAETVGALPSRPPFLAKTG